MENSRFKFRAWNGYSMYSPTIDGHYDISEYLNETENIMQFTGLLDKQGVEIYEGDIVKARNDIFEIQYGEHDLGYIFYVNSLGVHMSLSYLVGLEDFEVIGNIYKNKDLLS